MTVDALTAAVSDRLGARLGSVPGGIVLGYALPDEAFGSMAFERVQARLALEGFEERHYFRPLYARWGAPDARGVYRLHLALPNEDDPRRLDYIVVFDDKGRRTMTPDQLVGGGGFDCQLPFTPGKLQWVETGTEVGLRYRLDQGGPVYLRGKGDPPPRGAAQAAQAE